MKEGPLSFLFERWAGAADQPAMVCDDRAISYRDLSAAVRCWGAHLGAAGVEPGDVVAVTAEFGLESVACLLAAVQHRAVVVPLSATLGERAEMFCAIAEVQWTIEPAVGPEMHRRAGAPPHPLLGQLRATGHPGLVLFSSGSTGASKAAVHDLVPLLAKFTTARAALRAVSFLLFDHIGGFNTLLATLSSLGCVVVAEDRSPAAICRLIERWGVQLLPTSPTFLNLLLVSRAYTDHDLSSLRLITYGTEPMPEATLARLGRALPGVELKQTYGLSEVGILRTKSRGSDSLWMRMGGEGYELRVVDGQLEILAEAAMLGYLNAPSPFTPDGWFRTGDAVDTDGEWLRVLGRTSEIINVGGEKVYPAEVEGVLQRLDGVLDAVVHGEPHPLVGQIVVARLQIDTGEDLSSLRRRVRAQCRGQLEPFKIPQKIEIAATDLHGQRWKKKRSAA